MRKVFLIIAVPLVVLVNAFLPFAHWIAFRPGGSIIPLSFAALWPLLTIAAFLLIPVFTLLLLSKRARRFALAAIIILASHVFVFLIASFIASGIREHGITRLCERSRPLVQALHAYEQRVGRAPEKIEALTPEFLTQIPEIGLGDEYKLVTGEDARMRWGDRSWGLTLVVPSMWPFPEMLIYLPDRTYPETLSGLRLSRKIGDWGLYAWYLNL